MTRIAKLIQRHPFKAMVGLLILTGIAGYVAPVEAQEADPKALWVNVGGFSKHFEDRGRNETNLGLGAEYRLRSDVSIMAGYHENSLRLRTKYSAVNYQPLMLGPLKIGASVGVMTGYPAMNKGGSFFAALPMVTYEGNHVGFNFGVIPNVPSKYVEGAFVIQFKFKAF